MQQVNSWLQHAQQLLEHSEVPTARLDALILLEDALGKDRSWILAHPEAELSEANCKTLESQLIRRSTHEPLAYIRGRSEFYGRTFMVTPATLQPRPETETMLDLLTKLQLVSTPRLADIGTGSGAIAITASLEVPGAVVHATEIQPDALQIAHKNCKSLAANVTLHKGNLLEPLHDVRIDVILANLPYVPTGHTINAAAMQEPAVAIFGGEDGLDLYRELFEQVNSRHQKPAFILCESLPFQHADLAKIAKLSSYSVRLDEDFIQVFELIG